MKYYVYKTTRYTTRFLVKAENGVKAMKRVKFKTKEDGEVLIVDAAIEEPPQYKFVAKDEIDD